MSTTLTRGRALEEAFDVVQRGRDTGHAYRHLDKQQGELVVTQIQRLLARATVVLDREIRLDNVQELHHYQATPLAYEHLADYHHEQDVLRQVGDDVLGLAEVLDQMTHPHDAVDHHVAAEEHEQRPIHLHGPYAQGRQESPVPRYYLEGSREFGCLGERL